MFDLILYYLSFLFLFFSISGYGIILHNTFISNIYNKNFFVYFFYGISIITCITFFLNYLIPSNKFFNLFIILIGTFFFLKNFKKFEYQINISLILSTLLFAGILVSKTHEDFLLYHYQNIVELTDANIKIGLGNLNEKYVYSSLLTYFQSYLNFPYLELKLVHLPVYLFFFSIVGYLFVLCSEKNFHYENKKKALAFFLLIFFILKFKRYSEFGYDYISVFMVSFIFLEYLYLKKKININAFLFLFFSLVTFKVINLYFIPFLLFLLVNKKNTLNYFKNLKFNYFKNIIILIPLLILFLNSFFNSGCIFYPIKLTCFNKSKIIWSNDYKRISHERLTAGVWAKGYFHRENWQEKKKVIIENEKNLEKELIEKNRIERRTNYANKLHLWFPHWFNGHFKIKVSEFILIAIFSLIVCIIFLFDKKKIIRKKLFNHDLFVLFLSTLSVLFWLLTIPQLRFGMIYTIFLVYFLFCFFYDFQITKILKKHYFMLIIAIIFFNFSNFKRIDGEFKRNDIYKFKNFPWYTQHLYFTDSIQINDIKFNRIQKGKFFQFKKFTLNSDGHYNLIKDERDINYKKKFNYIILYEK